MNDPCEVAIVGAGPYALSLAAHLHRLGVSHRVFGSPMQAWRTQMPTGMQLKSDGFGSNLYAPGEGLTLERYCAEHRLPYAASGSPIDLATFCAYGLDFQARFVPHLEPCDVTGICVRDSAFLLNLDDGQSVRARRVVLAVGVRYFERIPAAVAALPPGRCSHSADCADLARFDGRDVTVIGAGASAIDVAALVQAAGARVRLVARADALEFHDGPSSGPRSLWTRLTQPSSGLGPSLRSLFYAEAPLAFHFLPERTRLRIARTYLGPAGGWFMRDRLRGRVEVVTGSSVQAARVQEGRVHLTLLDRAGASREVVTDHVIAATGYAVDMRRLTFLDPAVLSRMRLAADAPILSSHFETSVPGLHVVGPAAANAFGPVMRFAFGARFAARRLSRHLARTARRRSARHPASPALTRAAD